MFEQTFVQSQAKTRRPWTVVASVSIQCVVVSVLLVVPLLHPEKLRMPEPPKARSISTWVNLAQTPPPKTQSNIPAVRVPSTSRSLVWPIAIPHSTVATTVAIPSLEADTTAWAGPPGAPFGSSLAPTSALPPRVTPQPPPVAIVKPTISAPLKVGTGVQAAKLTFSPHPAYPQIAITTHTQGTVRLEAMIAADGTIRNLRTISGPPLLIEAALSAVRQWRYQPTLLNGVPVEVVTEIEVNFTLNR